MGRRTLTADRVICALERALDDACADASKIARLLTQWYRTDQTVTDAVHLDQSMADNLIWLAEFKSEGLTVADLERSPEQSS